MHATSYDFAESDDLHEVEGSPRVDDAVRLWMHQLRLAPLLTETEELSLARRVAQGDAHAERRMVEANLRLVVSVAKRYRRYSESAMSLSDLIQEGNLGLMKAVRKFDCRKGYRFSTYATYWIRQAITRALSDQSRSIRLPVYMADAIAKLQRTSVSMSQELGRQAEPEELARRLGLSVDQVTDMLRHAADSCSLDAPLADDEGTHLGDFLEDTESVRPDDAAALVILRRQIKLALDQLDEREREVICLRFGLDDGNERTLEEVGQRFALTRERIRQIELRALEHLRNGGHLTIEAVV